MPNFQEGKIYKLVSNQTNKIYIGSTTIKLDYRLHRHRSNYKNNESCRSSTKILKYGDAKIILLEKYPCNSKIELILKEQEYIDKHQDICVNIIRAKVDKKEYNREYARNHREDYREAGRKYMIKNKEKVYGKKKEKIICIYCGCLGRRGDAAKHKKSNKHRDAIRFVKSEL